MRGCRTRRRPATMARSDWVQGLLWNRGRDCHKAGTSHRGRSRGFVPPNPGCIRKPYREKRIHPDRGRQAPRKSILRRGGHIVEGAQGDIAWTSQKSPLIGRRRVGEDPDWWLVIRRVFDLGREGPDQPKKACQNRRKTYI